MLHDPESPQGKAKLAAVEELLEMLGYHNIKLPQGDDGAPPEEVSATEDEIEPTEVNEPQDDKDPEDVNPDELADEDAPPQASNERKPHAVIDMRALRREAMTRDAGGPPKRR